MTARPRAHPRLAAQVQGVSSGSRRSTRRAGSGVHGWVRNVADGRVEAEAEGERAEVEALVRWCGRGPPAARVDDVQVDWRRPRASPGPFTVRR